MFTIIGYVVVAAVAAAMIVVGVRKARQEYQRGFDDGLLEGIDEGATSGWAAAFAFYTIIDDEGGVRS